jgi:hypothetical protein
MSPGGELQNLVNVVVARKSTPRSAVETLLKQADKLSVDERFAE